MQVRQLLLCLIFAAGLSLGQVLFKLAADEIRAQIGLGLVRALVSPWLLAALCLYAAIMALWVYILTELPLSRAYPFSLLGSAMVPLAAVAVLGESIGLRYSLGFGLTLLGLVIIFAGD